jgi:UDP-N-acetylmuramoyl-tripeptide--D-alanyl-D-alanine ligase
MISIEALYSLFLKFPSVTTDTRNIRKGDIFFALKGPNFNANSMALQALESGAAYAVVDEDEFAKDPRCLLCKDVLKTLQALALFHRQQLRIPFIGITGSNGKTTTKELAHAVLSKKFRTLATSGNLNNHIGVPLTLLSITPKHEVAIIEMGANHVGEIKDLCALCLPDYGLITSIGKAHLEGFGSFEGVIKAKTELFDFIRKNKGILFVNADNDLLMGLSSGIKRVLYGQKTEGLVKGNITGMDPCLSIEWQKNEEGKKQLVHSQLIGQYNLDNMLASISIGIELGVADKLISEALAEYTPSNNRSQFTRTEHNALILDAYNANPSSLSAAIENFAQLEGKKKILIAGDMLELGPESTQEHRNIARLIQSKNFYRVILIGKEFEKIKGEIEADFYGGSKDALEWLKKNPIKGSIILVKGSRGVKLETLIEAL